MQQWYSTCGQDEGTAQHNLCPTARFDPNVLISHLGGAVSCSASMQADSRVKTHRETQQPLSDAQPDSDILPCVEGFELS